MKKNFTQVDAVRDVIKQNIDDDHDRSINRALIANVFNGETPFTQQEADDNNIETNVNFLEGPKIALDARSQFNNAFLKPANFFSVEIDLPDSTKALQFEKIITKQINRILKKSLAYMETLRAQFASVVMHGIGPVIWPNKEALIPDPFAVGDVLVPSRTRMDMRNLGYFPVRREWTPYELLKMTSGEHVDPGWNKPLAGKLLAELIERKYNAKANQNDVDFLERPEEAAELMRENSMYWASSAVPTIKCWDFFYQDCEDDEGQWKRCIILDKAHETKAPKDQFLYKTKRPYAESWSHIIHFQFGDAANSAPFRYHSIRSLGSLLYPVMHLQNRLRCKFSDAVFENLLMYFRVANPADLDRIQRVDLHHLGIWPEGLGAVKADERHIPDFNMVVTQLQQNRQLMAESAANYVQNVDDGRNKEMTASEVLAKQTAANAIVSSMLNLAFTYQTFQYEEICRRLLNKKSRDKDVRQFHQYMQREQVPDEALDFEKWTIVPERVLGAGNKTIEMLEAQQLMAVRPMLDPDGQRIVVHKFVLANSDDPRLADRLAPLDKPLLPSQSVVEAQQAAGVLLMGLPMGIRSGVNRAEYVGALIQSLTVAVQKVMQRGGVPQSPDELQGLQALVQHAGENLKLLGEDKQQAQVARQLEGVLTKLANEIRGFGQRLQKAMQDKANQNGGMDPEELQKLQAKERADQQKLKAKDATTKQKLQHSNMKFASEEQRKNVELRNRLGREGAEFQTEQALKDADKALEIQRTRELAAVEDETAAAETTE